MPGIRVSNGLIVILAVVFSVELYRHAIGNDPALLALGALPDSGELQREYWRLLTYAFLHAGWSHFLLNAGLLAWVGPVVERRLGGVRFLLLVLASTVLSGLAIHLRHRVSPSPGVSLGASGFLFALLGAALVLLHRAPRSPLPPRIGLWAVLVGGLLASLLGGVSLTGHLAGLLVGVLAVSGVGVGGRRQAPAARA